MVTYKCDGCGKEVKENEIDTMIICKQTIDYCRGCRVQVNRLKTAYIKSRNYYEEEFYKNIEEAEKNIYIKWKKKIKQKQTN